MSLSRIPLFVLLTMVLAGCATRAHVPEPAPPLPVAESTWQQVDRDIVTESLAAVRPAKSYARRQMEHWRQLVTQRADADFVPWYSSYLTQQWLTAKVAWYNLNAGDGGEPPVDRLAAYLQAQYHERVLAPVAKEVDPVSILAQASNFYIRRLAEQLQPIPQRYGIPAEQFQRRLQTIPAITLAPPPSHDASLYQVIYANPIDTLPAYVALLQQLRENGGLAEAGLSKTRISPVARQVSEDLLNRLAISGGAGAATTLIGGVAGTMLSIGAAGIGVMLHEAKRGEIEAHLRETLNASLDDMWNILMENRDHGVMAGIYYLSGQIEKSLPQTVTQAIKSEMPVVEMPLPEAPPGRKQVIDGEAPDANGER